MMRMSHLLPGHRRGAAVTRRGYTLIELTIASLLLGTAMGLIAPTLIWVTRERRASERRQEALQEVQNILERLTARPWAQVTPELAGETQLDEQVRNQLPDAKLVVEVSVDTDDAEAKRISVELKWKNGPEQTPAPVRLTTWMYRRGRTAQ